MKFLPIARTDGFLLWRGDGLSTASDPPPTMEDVMDDTLALDDCGADSDFSGSVLFVSVCMCSRLPILKCSSYTLA